MHNGHYLPVVAADACNTLIINNLQKNLQENLVKTDKKGNEESNGLLLSFSSLVVSGKSNYPLQYSSYFTHVRSMPSAGERQALFEFAVWSLKLAVTQLAVWSLKFGEWSCPSFRADLDRRERGVEKSFRAEPHAERAETAEPPVISSAAERSREILSCRSIAKREKISHRLHGFSRIFQSNNKFCSQASGLHGTAKRSCHAETAETAETPVISSAAERSREILSCRSIAKRKKSHPDYTDFHRFLSPPPN